MKNRTGFEFPVSYDSLTDAQIGALQKAEEAARGAIKGRPGSIMAQVFFDGADITVRGCFVEHEYASRINDILIERKKKLGLK